MGLVRGEPGLVSGRQPNALASDYSRRVPRSQLVGGPCKLSFGKRRQWLCVTRPSATKGPPPDQFARHHPTVMENPGSDWRRYKNNPSANPKTNAPITAAPIQRPCRAFVVTTKTAEGSDSIRATSSFRIRSSITSMGTLAACLGWEKGELVRNVGRTRDRDHGFAVRRASRQCRPGTPSRRVSGCSCTQVRVTECRGYISSQPCDPGSESPASSRQRSTQSSI